MERKKTYAQLNIILAQEHGASAKSCNGALSRYSGAGASLAECHGDGLARQRTGEMGPAMARLDVGLVLSGIPDECGELLRCEVGYGEQMSGRKGRSLRSRWRARACVGAALQLPQASNCGAKRRHCAGGNEDEFERKQLKLYTADSMTGPESHTLPVCFFDKLHRLMRHANLGSLSAAQTRSLHSALASQLR